MESNISLKPTLSPAITGVDPSTGKYFKNNAERIAYFKRTRVSGDRVFGNRKNDATRIQPQTSMVPESGGALVKTGGDSNLSSTVENIQKALSALQDTVKKISDSLLEEKKKKQEQEDKQKRSAKIAEEKDKASEEENLLEKTPDSLKNKL